jgi:uncharacterized FAD-dependent dehydrogenase
MGIRRKHIRDLTQKLIQKYNPSGVPIDVKRIAKALGIEVKVERVDDNLSGFLLREHKPKRTVRISRSRTNSVITFCTNRSQFIWMSKNQDTCFKGGT